MSGESVVINPLLIFKNIEQILSTLSLRELKKCRLVSSSWNQESVSWLQKKDHLVLHSITDFAKFNDAFISRHHHHRLIFPYKTCIIRSELMDSDNSEFMGYYPKASTFFQHFGTEFTQLHLALSNSSGHNAVKKLLKEIIFFHFPNLVTLSLLLKEGPFDYFDEGEEFQGIPKLRDFHVQWVGYNENQKRKISLRQLLIPIFVNAINLEKISCVMPSFCQVYAQSIPTEDASLGSEILECIFHHYASGQSGLKRLNQLDFLSSLNKARLGLLTSCLQPNLTTVSMQLTSETMNGGEDVLTAFFQKFKQTLKTLQLVLPVTPSSAHCGLLHRVFYCNRMEELSKLILRNCQSEMPLMFINCLPALQFIDMGGRNEGFISFRNEKKAREDSHNSNVLSLKISSKISLDQTELGRDLSLSFPNIRELVVENINNAILRGIFAHLSTLVKLDVAGKGISDEGICGGDSDELLRVHFEAALEAEKDAAVSPYWKFESSYPSIDSMKKLESFSVKAGLITDASLAFGIAKCERLKRLDIQPDLELITVIGLKTLASLKNLEYLRVYVRNHGWTSLSILRTMTSGDPHHNAD